jgi:hypothetical protein
MRNCAFQLAAVVGIVAIACVLLKIVPRPELAPAAPQAPQTPTTSALFQADLLAQWRLPKIGAGLGKVRSLPRPDDAQRDADAFLAVSCWAAQPHLPLPLGACLAIGSQPTVEKSRLVGALSLIHLAVMNPAARDALIPAAAVGIAANPPGPLAALSSLSGDAQLQAAFAQGRNTGGVVLEWRTTNFSLENGVSRKSYRDRFLGKPEEADRALRAFRGRLEEKARHLGADVRAPAETDRDKVLMGFSFRYTLGAAEGRVEVAIEPGPFFDYQMRLEVEERPMN